MSEPDSPNSSLVSAVERFVEERDLFGGVGRLVVACSGGGDSVALLDVMERRAGAWDLELAVAHLDHGWRGQESAADARFVAAMAKARGLELFSERSVPSGEGDRGPQGEGVAAGASEAAARAARLDFFRRVSARWDADVVALGHTADDRAETMLLNLLRGTGRTGLAAMRARSVVAGVRVVRPLLEQRRETVREYCAARGIEWREDASNRMERFARVRLRRQVMPVLEAEFPGAVGRLARTAGLLAAEDDWLAEMAREECERLGVAVEYPGAVALDASGLRRLATPLGRRVVRAALRRVRGGLTGIAREHVDGVLEVATGDGDAARDLPGVRARLEADTLELLPLEGRRLRPPDAD